MIKNIITTLLLLFVFTWFSSAQNEWVEHSDFKGKNTTIFKPEIRLFENGNFLLRWNQQANWNQPENWTATGFDDAGNKLKDGIELIQNQFIPKLIGRNKFTPRMFRQFNNTTFMLYGDSLIFSKVDGDMSPETTIVELEKPCNVNDEGKTVGLMWKTAQFVSYSDTELIFVQYYWGKSNHSHQGVTSSDEKQASFVRIAFLNLKDKSIKYKYCLLDYFPKGKRVTVVKAGQAITESISVLGFENNHIIFGVEKYTSTHLYARAGISPIITNEFYEGYCKIVTVDLDDLTEKELFHKNFVREKNDVYSMQLFPVKNGYNLSWTNSVKKVGFQNHIELYVVDKNLELVEKRIDIPLEDLAQKWGVPTYLKDVKDSDGNDWYAINVSFSNSGKRKDIENGTSVVMMINAEGEIVYRRNKILDWNVHRNFFQTEDNRYVCLPCYADFDDQFFSFSQELPAEIKDEKDVYRSIEFRKIGDTVYYAQYVMTTVVKDKGLSTKHDAVDRFFVRTGSFQLN